jgi:SAM-dependent methyltransferase
MAHSAQRNFCRRVKKRFVNLFDGANVLDCGSLDINGNNRFLFTNSTYTGIDVGPGNNVDIVSLTHEFQAAPESFDIVISTECLEHDLHYDKSLKQMVNLLRRGGLMLFTCATTGRKEHGTERTSLRDCPYITWKNYYKNLTEVMIRDVIDVDSIFTWHQFEVESCDLYFCAIKKYKNIL